MGKLTCVLDRIHIEQLEFRARLGVSKRERAEPQRIVCNITLWPQKRSDLGDEIANTVDYSAVAESVRELVGRSEFRLIEAVAEKLAADLVRKFGVTKVMVEVRKFVLSDAEFVSVTATQEAAVG